MVKIFRKIHENWADAFIYYYSNTDSMLFPDDPRSPEYYRFANAEFERGRQEALMGKPCTIQSPFTFPHHEGYQEGLKQKKLYENLNPIKPLTIDTKFEPPKLPTIDSKFDPFKKF